MTSGPAKDSLSGGSGGAKNTYESGFLTHSTDIVFKMTIINEL